MLSLSIYKLGFSCLWIFLFLQFLERKEPELHASRQVGLIDFIASAMPASHTPRPDAPQANIQFLLIVVITT